MAVFVATVMGRLMTGYTKKVPSLSVAMENPPFVDDFVP